MNKVQQKPAASKKGAGAPKKRPKARSRAGVEQWVSDGILRAAERTGITSVRGVMKTPREMLSQVLREECQVLLAAMDDVVESRAQDEFGLEAFEKALRALRTVRVTLEGEEDKLESTAAATTAVAS